MAHAMCLKTTAFVQIARPAITALETSPALMTASVTPTTKGASALIAVLTPCVIAHPVATANCVATTVAWARVVDVTTDWFVMTTKRPVSSVYPTVRTRAAAMMAAAARAACVPMAKDAALKVTVSM